MVKYAETGLSDSVTTRLFLRNARRSLHHRGMRGQGRRHSRDAKDRLINLPRRPLVCPPPPPFQHNNESYVTARVRSLCNAGVHPDQHFKENQLGILDTRRSVEREDAVLHELEGRARLHASHAVLAVLEPLVPRLPLLEVEEGALVDA